MKRSKVLILGGTGEARALADALVQRGECLPVTSLAGRTRLPMLPGGAVRHGGFGGAEGLAAYLEAENIAMVVDATHPFAEQISHHAAQAAKASGVPRLVLLRPPWQAIDGDKWVDVASTTEAASSLPAIGRRVFLGIGRQDLQAFAAVRDVWFLIRSIEAAGSNAPMANATYIRARGPFSRDMEMALFRQHRIDCLVTRNAGGDATYAKIAAARELALPVLMIGRPPAPPGEQVGSVNQALTWIADRLHLSC